MISCANSKNLHIAGWFLITTKNSGRPEDVLLFEFKREASDGITPLEQLAQGANCQAEQKYLEGAREKWHPKEIIIYGVGFRGKLLALVAGEACLRGD